MSPGGGGCLAQVGIETPTMMVSKSVTFAGLNATGASTRSGLCTFVLIGKNTTLGLGLPRLPSQL